jgi:ubiquinone biosynthesis protein
MNYPRRALQIAAALGPFAGETLAAQGAGLGLGEAGRDDRRGELLREGLEQLGPVFIKLGQLLSTRPDMVSTAMMRALQRLQARVEPMPSGDVVSALREHAERLGGDPFSTVDLQPLASASLAQVHRARLREGQEVAIKIRRRGVVPQVQQDLKLLSLVARAGQRLTPEGVYDLPTMVEELAQALQDELDLRSEAENLQLFRRNLGGWGPSLRVPAVHEELTTEAVLVMELIHGVPLGDGGVERLPQAGRAEIARSLAHAYFQMFFIDNVFHADPHPGNLLVTERGELVLLDFGMVGRIERQVADNLVRVLLNFQLKNSHGVAHAFLDIGKPTHRADELGWVMDVRRLLPRYHGMRLERLNVGMLLVDLLKNAARNGIQAPPVVALVCKSLANMDGTARLIDPGIDIVSAFQGFLPIFLEAYAGRLTSVEEAVKVALDLYIGGQRVPFQLGTILEKLATGRLRIVIDPLRER